MHVDVAAVDFEQLFLAGLHRRFVDVDEELFAVYHDAPGGCLREVGAVRDSQVSRRKPGCREA